MKDNALSVVYLVAGAIIPYLLTQSDVSIPPILKVLLTATNLALVALARFSNPNSQPVQVQVTTPVAVTPTASVPAENVQLDGGDK